MSPRTDCIYNALLCAFKVWAVIGPNGNVIGLVLQTTEATTGTTYFHACTIRPNAAVGLHPTLNQAMDEILRSLHDASAYVEASRDPSPKVVPLP